MVKEEKRYFVKVLTSQQLTSCQSFSYRGGDLSLAYKYFLSPLAQWLVDQAVPRTMAPNTITLLGLWLSLVSVLLTLFYNPSLEVNKGPAWLHLAIGACIFSYQTLDNMDGKQARKTGSSSPLGLLFDHGCDAVNAVITAIPMGHVLGTGWTVAIFFTLWCSFVPFYFQTWEEYYVGSMILPIINGPSEGLLIAVGMCIMSFLFTSNFWYTDVIVPIVSLNDIYKSFIAYIIAHIEKITYFKTHFHLHLLKSKFGFMIILAVSIASITVLGQTISVILFLYKRKGPVIHALFALVPFLIFYPSVFLYCLHSEIALTKYPIITLITIGSIFVESVVHMMLMHVCDGPLSPHLRIFALFSFLLPLNIVLTPKEGLFIDEAIFLHLYCFASITVTTMILYVSCLQIADHLNIFVFSIEKVPKSEKVM